MGQEFVIYRSALLLTPVCSCHICRVCCHQPLAFNHLVKSQLLTDEQVSLSVDKKGGGLTYSRKLYEFYTAPITKFWLHTVGRPCTLASVTQAP